MDTSLIFDCQVSNVNMDDSPDFVDAYISEAFMRTNHGTRELTEEELDKLNENGEYVYQKVMEHLF